MLAALDKHTLPATAEQVVDKGEAADPLVLEISGLTKHFPIRKGLFRRQVATAKAVEEVDLSLHAGETLGVVGESGCGKSTLARLILRLIEPTSGTISFRASEQSDRGSGALVDITRLSGRALKRLRRQVQMIFQDPYLSLNPRMKIRTIIAEPMTIHTDLSRAQRNARVVELLSAVGLRAEMAERYPHELSGGQRQRVSIARALAVGPSVIIADEPVSALDVSVQAQVIELLISLQNSFGLSFIFISHDLSVVKYICDRVAVMYLGQVVEMGTAEEMFAAPRHPYTEALIQSIPEIGRPLPSRDLISGEISSNINPPSGCRFHRRCLYAKEKCSVEEPGFWTDGNGHLARCHFSSELVLEGVRASDDGAERR